MLGQVALRILRFELQKAALGLLSEVGGGTRLRIAELGGDVVLGGFHLGRPVALRRQSGFGSCEIGRQRAQIGAQRGERLRLLQSLETVAMRDDLLGLVAEVLQLAGRVVGLQRLQERLGVVKPTVQLRGFVFRQQSSAPEDGAVAQVLACDQQLFNRRASRFLHLLHRLVLALRDQLGHARRQAEQLEEGGQRRQVPLLGAFDVLEAGQIADGNGR